MRKHLWIGGEFTDTAEYRQLLNPFTNESLAEIPIASPSDVNKAISSADAARNEMAAMPAWRRAEILETVARIFADRKEEAATILSNEAAKTITTARGEIDRVVQTYQFAAEEAKQIHGETVPMDAAPGGVGKNAYIRREPLGIIGAISPFNFPLNLVAHKIGPAVASGNTVVLKPASQTPLSAFLTAEIFHEAGLPAGALNIITGEGSTIGEQLVTDDRVKMITFTGSPEVGKRIRSIAGLKRVTLELGSNSAAIVDHTVSIDEIVPRCVTAAFSYQGQVCISLQRIFVHESIMNRFLDKFVERTERLVGGDPLSEKSDYSTLITANDAERLMSWIDGAKEVGGKVLTGGSREGNMITPTVMVNVPTNIPISCREAFGPIVVIYPFSKMSDAIDSVNNSVYGLQAGVFTSNIDHAIAASEKIEAGAVLINEVPTFRVDQMPYGGVKDSGMGREGLKYAIEEMTEMKLVVFQPSSPRG